jgi:transcriptional regulator of heat shock response
MEAKGGAAPEVVMQAVLMSFEAQDISRSKLVEAARKYKDILKQKNDDFLSGAAAEKNNQLQKRENVLREHNDAVQQIQQQLQQLELQKQQLQESLNKEKTQMEVDKSLGQEGIQKIEKAERLISIAHEYMQSTIDNDIKRLQAE